MSSVVCVCVCCLEEIRMVGMENKQGGKGSGRKIEIIGYLGTWELFLEALRLCWERL